MTPCNRALTILSCRHFVLKICQFAAMSVFVCLVYSEGHDHNVTFNETITRFVLTQLISVTSPSVTRPSNVSVNIQFKWNETYMKVNATRTYPWQFSPFLLTITADNPFEYRSNPTISKIYPLQQLNTWANVYSYSDNANIHTDCWPL
jgi:hypothetical protein